MGKQHVIELNGQRYDAATGKKLSVPSIPSNPSMPPVSRRRKSIDGFVRAVTMTSRGQSQSLGRRVEKSKTLMRTVVKRPAQHKSVSTAQAAAPKKTAQSQASKIVSPSRLAHAQAVAKNALVRRFNTDVTPVRLATMQPTASAQALRLQSAPAASVETMDPLARGLGRATSHEEAKLKRPKRHIRVANRLHISPRILSTGALVLAGLLIGGFFAYQNLPNLNMRLAAVRSGVHGSLPGYTPAGFSLSDSIAYSPGQIIVSYHSNSDSRAFRLVQSTTSWNSQTLLSDYVAKIHPNNQTVYPKGKTVYLYDNNATWVDSGIWYRIEGNSQLNSDQLQSIANSL